MSRYKVFQGHHDTTPPVPACALCHDLACLRNANLVSHGTENRTPWPPWLISAAQVFQGRSWYRGTAASPVPSIPTIVRWPEALHEWPLDGLTQTDGKAKTKSSVRLQELSPGLAVSQGGIQSLWIGAQGVAVGTDPGEVSGT